MNNVLIGFPHKNIKPVGSRVTCNPPPSNTDCDWLVLVDPNEFDNMADYLQLSGWSVAGSLIEYADNTLPPDERFNSFRLDDDNVILTASDTFFARFMAATSVAKRLNLLNKDDRIALFQAVLYGKETTNEADLLPTMLQGWRRS